MYYTPYHMLYYTPYHMLYYTPYHSSEDDVCEEALPLLANRGAVMPPATLRPTWNLQ